MMNKQNAKLSEKTNNAKKLQVDGIPIHTVFNTIFIMHANAQDSTINTPGDVLLPNANASLKGFCKFIYNNYRRKYYLL